MAAQQLTPLPANAQYWGTKLVASCELNGPASYATGGQVINASQLGLGGFDAVLGAGGLSYSGTYYFRVQYMPVSATPSKLNANVTQVKILWYVLATNAEVAAAVDISNEIVRVTFISC